MRTVNSIFSCRNDEDVGSIKLCCSLGLVSVSELGTRGYSTHTFSGTEERKG